MISWYPHSSFHLRFDRETLDSESLWTYQMTYKEIEVRLFICSLLLLDKYKDASIVDERKEVDLTYVMEEIEEEGYFHHFQ